MSTAAEEQATAEALAFFNEPLESSDAPPPPRAEPAEEQDWHPDLNPTQQLIFDDPSDSVLGHGEKGSGKTIGFGHKIVRHLYENDNAYVLTISPSISSGSEGIWHDLETLIFPAWRDGNRDKEGNLMDNGIGLEYTVSKLDPLTKDRHRWVKNRFGGWSKVILKSIPFATQVEARVAGPAPSMVYVDELDKTDGNEYYKYPSAQLGRRRGIAGPQQFCASCNPKGPSHWVYKIFWVDHMNQETGERDPGFSVYHVPIIENKHRLPPGYVERLMALFKSDPTEYARLINGEWIDRPTGEGLFREYYNEKIHIKGDAIRNVGLKPVPGFFVRIGYDLGQVYNSITFMQLIPTKKKWIWIVFDEVDYQNKKVLYKMLAWEVIEKMRFWRRKLDYDFKYMHIADESAVNQYRPGTGSYDARDFEKQFALVQTELNTGGKAMKMLGCPKGDGSVAARVRLLQNKLYQEEIFGSALCKNFKDMLLFLEPDKNDPENPKRSKFLHKFDSVTYPMFKAEMSGDDRINFAEDDSGSVGLIQIGQR